MSYARVRSTRRSVKLGLMSDPAVQREAAAWVAPWLYAAHRDA